jgi:hypothetical protein
MEEFYDAQAQSLLHGHIDVPAPAIDREAFVRNGKYYGYFGPTPALLRIPAMMFASDTYGRWSRISMFSGSLVILAALILLFRRLEQAMSLEGPLWAMSRYILIVSTTIGSPAHKHQFTVSYSVSDLDLFDGLPPVLRHRDLVCPRRERKRRRRHFVDPLPVH